MVKRMNRLIAWLRFRVGYYKARRNTYKCDPRKNAECRKTNCYVNGGPCKRTSKKECRK